MYTDWMWQCDLNNLLNFFNQRLRPKAQWEIRQYAEALAYHVWSIAPVSFEAWFLHQGLPEEQLTRIKALDLSSQE